MLLLLLFRYTMLLLEVVPLPSAPTPPAAALHKGIDELFTKVLVPS